VIYAGSNAAQPLQTWYKRLRKRWQGLLTVLSCFVKWRERPAGRTAERSCKMGWLHFGGMWNWIYTKVIW